MENDFAMFVGRCKAQDGVKTVVQFLNDDFIYDVTTWWDTRTQSGEY